MSKYKEKKPSMIEFTRKYANNDQACEEFFLRAKYPNGYYCEKCGCTHYKKISTRSHVYTCSKCGHLSCLFAGTIFQDCKLDLYKLLLGLFIFFTSNKGVSAMEMRSQLDVNYKTALLLCRKCRVLMTECNSEKILDNMFYEADVSYIGSRSKEPGHQGCGTEQQPFFIALSTSRNNNYPQFIKLRAVPKDDREITNAFLTQSLVLSKDRTLNTDGKTTFNIMKDRITVVNEKIDYSKDNHRLYWLNTILGDIKNNIIGIYHGARKIDLPLFFGEQEYRFNHRNTGKQMMDKVAKYISKSHPMTCKQITNALNASFPIFAQ